MASKHTHEPGLGETLREDFRRRDLFHHLQEDARQVRDFFLAEERKNALAAMHPVKRVFVMPWWLLRALLLKLAPVRRILLLFGIALLIGFRSGDSGDGHNSAYLLGAVILLFIILLELKDKLIARDELLAGRAVQNALTPPRTPDFPGWDIWVFTRPANDVGGDLADYLRVGDKRLDLSLGDVAGKGLPAALFMARLQATIRAVAPVTESIEELGAALNGIFCRDGLPSRFASLVYLRIATDSGAVRVLNCGHMPPLHIRGADVSALLNGGPALGLLASATYREQQAELAAGDTLVVYSDGVTEARNIQGLFFGEERLRRLLQGFATLPATTMGEHTLEHLERFTAGAPVSDDLSILILKRLPA